VILTFKDIIKEAKKDQNLNVNIGIDKKRNDFKKIVDKIEKEIEKLGGSYNNEGGDKDTYNINAGFGPDSKNIKIGNKFADRIQKIADFVDTETMDA